MNCTLRYVVLSWRFSYWLQLLYTGKIYERKKLFAHIFLCIHVFNRCLMQWWCNNSLFVVIVSKTIFKKWFVSCLLFLITCCPSICLSICKLFTIFFYYINWAEFIQILDSELLKPSTPDQNTHSLRWVQSWT